MHSGAMSTDRMWRGSATRDGPATMTGLSESSACKRAVRGAADMRLAAGHLELASRASPSTQISPLLSRSSTPAIRSNAFGNSLRCAAVRVHDAQCRGRGLALARSSGRRNCRSPTRQASRCARVRTRRRPRVADDGVAARVSPVSRTARSPDRRAESTEQRVGDALDDVGRGPLHVDLRGAHVRADHDLVALRHGSAERAPAGSRRAADRARITDAPGIAEDFAVAVIGRDDDVGVAQHTRRARRRPRTRRRAGRSTRSTTRQRRVRGPTSWLRSRCRRSRRR